MADADSPSWNHLGRQGTGPLPARTESPFGAIFFHHEAHQGRWSFSSSVSPEMPGRPSYGGHVSSDAGCGERLGGNLGRRHPSFPASIARRSCVLLLHVAPIGVASPLVIALVGPTQEGTAKACRPLPCRVRRRVRWAGPRHGKSLAGPSRWPVICFVAPSHRQNGGTSASMNGIWGGNCRRMTGPCLFFSAPPPLPEEGSRCIGRRLRKGETGEGAIEKRQRTRGASVFVRPAPFANLLYEWLYHNFEEIMEEQFAEKVNSNSAVVGRDRGRSKVSSPSEKRRGPGSP